MASQGPTRSRAESLPGATRETTGTSSPVAVSIEETSRPWIVKTLSVRGELDRSRRHRRRSDPAKQVSGNRLPKTHGAVHIRRSDHGSIGRVGDGVHVARVCVQVARTSLLDVPRHGPIRSARGQPFSVGAEGQRVREGVERDSRVAGRDVPNEHVAGRPRRCKTAPVRRELHPTNATSQPGKVPQHRLRVDFAQQDRVGFAFRGRDQSPVGTKRVRRLRTRFQNPPVPSGVDVVQLVADTRTAIRQEHGPPVGPRPRSSRPRPYRPGSSHLRRSTRRKPRSDHRRATRTVRPRSSATGARVRVPRFRRPTPGAKDRHPIPPTHCHDRTRLPRASRRH